MQSWDAVFTLLVPICFLFFILALPLLFSSSTFSLFEIGSYLVTASRDKTWNFYDIATASCLQTVSDDKVSAGYTKVEFHPDGLYLGLGTEDSLVRMIDVRL